MSAQSKIEWTDATWNPMRGCNKVSPGCVHCYAEIRNCSNRRWQARGARAARPFGNDDHGRAARAPLEYTYAL